MSEWWPAGVIAFSLSLQQRNPAGDPASAPSAWGGVSAAYRQRSAEPHPAGWATTSQVPAFVFATYWTTFLRVCGRSSRLYWLDFCRQRKDELEQRMSTLQESRRELMVQLEQLMMLLKVAHSKVFVVWSVLLVYFELHQGCRMQMKFLSGWALFFLQYTQKTQKAGRALVPHSVCHKPCKPSGFIPLSVSASQPLRFCPLPSV